MSKRSLTLAPPCNLVDSCNLIKDGSQSTNALPCSRLQGLLQIGHPIEMAVECEEEPIRSVIVKVRESSLRIRNGLDGILTRLPSKVSLDLLCPLLLTYNQCISKFISFPHDTLIRTWNSCSHHTQ